jgi:putative hydrolase of the HAD superfamily
MKALVLDFGGPVLRTPFELLRSAGARTGLAPGTLDWSGPFAPERDELWRLQQSGGISEREYWSRRAEDFAALTGREPTFRGLMDEVFAAPESELVRPEALAVMRAARDAGFAVAVCTNDLRAFHGDAWVDALDVLTLVDVVVDGSVEHILKPDPRIYHLVTDRLGIAADDCLFVDDQPGNIAGAEAVGMAVRWFDVTAPEATYAQVRADLGLDA